MSPSTLPLIAGFEPATLTQHDVAALAGLPAKGLKVYFGKTIPPPDLTIGKKLLRWRRSTIERWLRGEWTPDSAKGVTNEPVTA
jgi:hypothetical protein